MNKENKIKYNEFVDLFEQIGITNKDCLESIYDSISKMDKTIKLDKFISLFLNQGCIDEFIKSDIRKVISRSTFSCVGYNMEFVINNGISIIEKLNKYCKNYLGIFVDKLINAIEEAQKVKIPRFNDIDFTNFKSAYEIAEILKYKFKYHFKNIARPNAPEKWIEIVVFDLHNRIPELIETGLEAYNLLGGKADNYINIEMYDHETENIRKFYEQMHNEFKEKAYSESEFVASDKIDNIIDEIPTLEACKKVVELISEKSKKVIEKYKNGELSKYSNEETKNKVFDFFALTRIDHRTAMYKFLKDVELLLYFKRYDSKSILICNLCKYGLLDEDLQFISNEIIVDVSEHLSELND